MAAGAQPPRGDARGIETGGVAHGAHNGAGGGGFLVVVTKEPDDRAGVQAWGSGRRARRATAGCDREGLVVVRGEASSS